MTLTDVAWGALMGLLFILIIIMNRRIRFLEEGNRLQGLLLERRITYLEEERK